MSLTDAERLQLTALALMKYNVITRGGGDGGLIEGISLIIAPSVDELSILTLTTIDKP